MPIEELEALFRMLNPGDSILSAGGDGTIHCVVNALIAKFGISELNQFSIGYIGLGSNNSFLQPTKNIKNINGIPVRIDAPSALRDLIEVKVDDQRLCYLISNGSLGLLAQANCIFNSDKQVAGLKKLNTGIADFGTFLMALSRCTPLQIEISKDGKVQYEGAITNLHIIKNAYYTKDLHFFTEVTENDGGFELFRLNQLSRLEILQRFLRMAVFGDMTQGFHTSSLENHLVIQTNREAPFEMDGEIIYGSKFDISVHSQALRVLT